MRFKPFLGPTFGLTAAVVLAVSSQAQTPATTPATRTPSSPSGASAQSGSGSLSGVWANAAFKDYRVGEELGRERTYQTADGQPIPFQPWAQKLYEERLHGLQDGKPYARNSSKCITEGMPDSTTTPAQLPIEILETPDQITVLYELLTTFRIIHMNQKHAADPDPSYMGDAVGHWEGDTLVVDTIGITDKTTIMDLLPHSDQLHVIERLRRTGPNTMEDDVTLEDPKAFTRPWRMVQHFKRVPGMQIHEFYCEDNRNPADANGNSVVQLQSN